MVLRAGLSTSRSPGFDLGNSQPKLSSLRSPAWPTPSWDHLHPHQEGSNAHSPFTAMKTPHSSRVLSSSEPADTTININHNKAMIPAVPSLDATKGALPHKKGLAGHFTQEYLELHLPGPAASRVLPPPSFLQHLELNVSHQVHDQSHLPPSC